MSQQNESQLTLIDKFAEKTKSGWKGLYQCSCGNIKLIEIPYWDYNKLCEDYFISELGIK